jgi:hypothetical protein
VAAIRETIAARGGLITGAAHGYGVVEALRDFFP